MFIYRNFESFVTNSRSGLLLRVCFLNLVLLVNPGCLNRISFISSRRRAMSRLGVVFGGSRGIGRAVAQLLARRGHRVVVISRDQEGARATADALSGGGSLKPYVFRGACMQLAKPSKDSTRVISFYFYRSGTCGSRL